MPTSPRATSPGPAASRPTVRPCASSTSTAAAVRASSCSRSPVALPASRTTELSPLAAAVTTPRACPARAAASTSSVTPAAKAETPSSVTRCRPTASTSVPDRSSPRPSATTRSSTRSNTPSEPGGVSSTSAPSRAPTTSCGAGARSEPGRSAPAAAGVGTGTSVDARPAAARSRERCETGAPVSVQRSVMTTSASGRRRDQPARSRPGAGGRSSGQPRHIQPSVTTPGGRSSKPASSSGRKSVTQPIPSPSARAASHRFWIAQAQDHTSESGKVARPSTPAAGTRRSQHTTTPSGASRRPSSCRSSRWRADSGSSWAACRSRSASAIREACSRRAGSRTTRNRHGWECPTDGAAWPACRTRVSSSSGTGSGR